MPKITTLDNGLRILTLPKSSSTSATIMIHTESGSRYETNKNNGIAHFLEHMFFKGAATYKTPAEVASAIDGIGADFNAFTQTETVAYYIKCGTPHIPHAISVLADMLLHSKFATPEIEHEKGVILEELNMYQDIPMYQIAWEFNKLIFGNHTPLGRDQIGTKENIKNFQRTDFTTYKAQLYTPDNTIIAVAGGFDEQEIIKTITSKFASMTGKKVIKRALQPQTKVDSNLTRVKIIDKKTEQTHLHLGCKTYPHNHRLQLATKLLSVLIGGNMSSRMFQNIREKQGLCYQIRSSATFYIEDGIFVIDAGIALDQTEDAVRSIMHELAVIREQGFSAAEITRAKNYLTGKLALSFEDHEHLAYHFGSEYLLYDEALDLPDYHTAITNISTAELDEVIQTVLPAEKMYLAMIGPFANQEAKFLKIIS